MLTRAAISGDSFPSVSQHHLTVTTEQKLALENYPLVTRSCAGALQGGKFSKLQWKLFACELTRWTGWSDVCLVSFFCVVVCHCMSSLGCCNSLVSALKVVMSLLVTMPLLRKVRYFFTCIPPPSVSLSSLWWIIDKSQVTSSGDEGSTTASGDYYYYEVPYFPPLASR